MVEGLRADKEGKELTVEANRTRGKMMEVRKVI